MGRRTPLAGLLIGLGGFLMAGPLAYGLYGALAERGLDRLAVEVEPPPVGSLATPLAVTALAPASDPPAPEEGPVEGRGAPPSAPRLGPVPLAPGFLLPARTWADPGAYRRGARLPQDLGDFRPVGPGETWPVEQAVRIRIPAIGVDSAVKELEVVDLGDSRAWETPAFVVGHIPTTPFPGQPGTGWYFGHLESPIRNEGNVFFRLPEIPGLLNLGEPVFVVLETPSRRFLYRVYRTEVVPQEDLAVRSEGALPEIALVTCVPRLTYDHRLIVTARLVGVAEGGSG